MAVITAKASEGEMIPLYCVNHPHLVWYTKNIDYIGARKIFFDLFHVCSEDECACSASDLRPLYDKE